jgi:hypothetical protein
MEQAKRDTRIVYGANCVWWDSIDKVAVKQVPGGRGPGLPCCPHCGSVLFETDEPDWFKGMDKYEADGHPGYRAMMEWSRGKCFRTMTALKTTYETSGS